MDESFMGGQGGGVGRRTWSWNSANAAHRNGARSIVPFIAPPKMDAGTISTWLIAGPIAVPLVTQRAAVNPLERVVYAGCSSSDPSVTALDVTALGVTGARRNHAENR